MAVGGVVLLAATNFFWRLASPNYFADEVLSIWNASAPLHQVPTLVNQTETNPWTYFLLLHEWLGHTGSQSEWSTRLPSAIAGIALIAAVYWLASTLLPRVIALAAAALCALSPLVLQYAQEVRGYVFVMLALTLAAAATVRAVQRPHHRDRLLVVGAIACVAGLWLHYMAVLVVAPLCVWLITRREVPRRVRAAFVGVCAVAELLMVPLFVEQYHNSGGLNGIANLTFNNAATVIGTPFAGRFARPPEVITLVAMAVVVVSVARLWTHDGSIVRNPRLVAALAGFPPIALLLIALAGKDVVATRYSAMAAPLMVLAIVAAAATLRRPLATGLLAPTVAVAIWGVAVTHSRSGFYPGSKQIMGFIRTHREPGDAVGFFVRLGVQWPFEFYGDQSMRPPPTYIDPNQTRAVLAALRERRRIWVIAAYIPRRPSTRALLHQAATLLRPYGYRPTLPYEVTTATTAVTYLADPGR